MKATDIIDDVEEAAGDGCVTAGEVVEALGHRGLGAMLMIPAAVELTPIGGIPGVPTILATIIAIFAVQIAIGRDQMYLPSFLSKRSVSSQKLDDAIEKMRSSAEWADRHLGQHLRALSGGLAHRLAAVTVLCLCLTIPFLELVPFASSIPTSLIVLFGLGLLTRDGRVMAFAWAATIFGVWGIWRLVT